MSILPTSCFAYRPCQRGLRFSAKVWGSPVASWFTTREGWPGGMDSKRLPLKTLPSRLLLSLLDPLARRKPYRQRNQSE